MTTTYCCTLYDNDANLLHSFCLVSLDDADLHCPKGWTETLVNECTACPDDPSTRDQLVAAIEADAPGLSQYAA